MKSVLVKEIETFCENSEVMFRSILTLWQAVQLALHFYLLLNSDSISTGASVYCYIEIIILILQLLFRHLKRLERNTKHFFQLQKIVCILHFLNFVPLCLIVFNVFYFEIDNQFGIRLLQLLALQTAAYYVFLFCALVVFLYRHSKRSKTGIRNATLIPSVLGTQLFS